MEKCKGTESQGVSEGKVGSSSGHPFICRSSLGRNYALVKGEWMDFGSYSPPHRIPPYSEQPVGSLGAQAQMASLICGCLCSLLLLPLLISIVFFSLQTIPSSTLGGLGGMLSNLVQEAGAGPSPGEQNGMLVHGGRL